MQEISIVFIITRLLIWTEKSHSITVVWIRKSVVWWSPVGLNQRLKNGQLKYFPG